MHTRAHMQPVRKQGVRIEVQRRLPKRWRAQRQAAAVRGACSRAESSRVLLTTDVPDIEDLLAKLRGVVPSPAVGAIDGSKGATEGRGRPAIR